jgi:hypothetical protein
MFYSNPIGCTIFFFLEKFENETDRAKVTVSQHQYLLHGINTPNHKKPMAVHYSCVPDDGCM